VVVVLRRCVFALIAACATVVLAVPAAGVAGDTLMPAPGPCATQTRAITQTMNVAVDGDVRQAVVHLPARAVTDPPSALVIALHGSGGDGAFMEAYSGFDTVADRHHFIVAYPSSHAGMHRWQLHPDPDQANDDIEFMRALIAQATGTLCVDPTRVDAVGVSNGGAFVARMACALSDQLAAIATVAGSYKVIPWCHPARPLSVLEIHGTADVVVPYRTVSRWLNQWRIHDGCHGAARRTHIAWDADRMQWTCAEGTVVSHVRLYGLGHAWPGSPLDNVGGIVAADKVWAMFASRRQAPLYR
jgi:polyhydroxybutyrate depolymerase